MSITNIKNYATPHDKESGGSGSSTILIRNVSNADLPDNISIGSINASNADIDYVQGKSLSYNNGNFIYVASNTGQISKLNGDEITYKNGVFSSLNSDSISTGKLKAEEIEIDKATISNINSKNITTENITVTKQAHFFELIVDKIRSVSGTTIQTAANCVIDWVDAYDANDTKVALDANNVAYYDVYWLAKDPAGRTLTNDWLVNDQAICQSFNNMSEGVNYDVSNKYYWRLVKRILPSVYMNINTGETTTQAQSTVNSVQITNCTIKYMQYEYDEDQQINEYVEETSSNNFNIAAQTLPGQPTGVIWNGSTNTMTTNNTIFGIQLTPNQNISSIVPTKFSFECSSARLNVGIYYANESSQYFPSTDTAQTAYEFDLNTENPIEAIVITNADEVSWHFVHGIRLSNLANEKDADQTDFSSIPSKGDNIAQLGYRGTDQPSRSSAIIIAAYHTPDTDLIPPSYAQYSGINNFDLSSKRGTFMDAVRSEFRGDFKVTSGTTAVPLDDYISGYVPEYHMYTAYANSADGTVDFTTDPTYAPNRTYMGICSTTLNTAPNTPSSYSWFLIQGTVGPAGPQGPAGSDAIQYVLIDQGSKAYVNTDLDGNNNMTQAMIISLRYKVVKIEGSSASIMSYNDLINFNNNNGTTGMYAYTRFSTVASEYDSANYVYWRMRLSNDNNDGCYTWTGPWTMPNITSEKVISDNTVLTTVLLSYNAGLNGQGNPNTISEGASALSYAHSTQTISVTLESKATLSILQGQNASIAALVSGYNGLTSSVSQLSIGMTAISTTVQSHSVEIDELSGQVTNNTNSISNIQQTSGSIISTVQNLNAGTKNYFNFNFCQFIKSNDCQTIPYIQGYGIEGYQNNNTSNEVAQIRNIDFGNLGGDFGVCCWMKIKSDGPTTKAIKVSLCDTEPDNIESSDKKVNVSTSWQFYKFIYKNVQASNVQAVNGHITFIADAGTIMSPVRLIVKGLMITRGNIPADQNISWKDYESVMTRNEALAVKDNEWTYTELDIQNSKFKGYPIYRYNRSTDYASTTSQVDLIYKNNIELKQDKIYTLSFYAKLDTKQDMSLDYPEKKAAFLYANGGCVNSNLGIDVDSKQIDIQYNIGQPSIGNNENGRTSFKLNGTTTNAENWQQFIIHWYNDNEGNRNCIALRVEQPSANTAWYPRAFSIAGVELREGWWDVDGLNSNSMIKQTADEIELKVKDTGINIDDGTITLSADNTIVDGNLILKNNDGAEGLVFRNSSNEDGLSLATSTLPSLNDWLTNYSGYPRMNIATNGFGYQSDTSSYIYASTSELALHNGAAGGVNNEYHIDLSLKSSGGRTGEISDYIGSTVGATTSTNTALVNFLAQTTMVQHNGVRIIKPTNIAQSVFEVSSKDRILLCDPDASHSIKLKFPRLCVGSYYFIKRLHHNGRIYIDGFVFAGNSNLDDWPWEDPYIEDDGLWMAIIVDELDTRNANKTQIILNKIADNDRPNAS